MSLQFVVFRQSCRIPAVCKRFLSAATTTTIAKSTTTMPPQFKVLVTRLDFFQEALELLIKDGCELVLPQPPPPEKPSLGSISKDTLLKLLPGVNGILCNTIDKIDKQAIDTAGPSLKVISTSSVGYCHIALDVAKERGIKVGHTPELVTDATAELTLALLLATSRRLFEGNADLRNGNWVWTPTWLCGKGLKGSTVGIFGLGRIGQAVLNRLVPFGVKKFVYNSRTPKTITIPTTTPVVPVNFVTFDELLTSSDFIIVTAALTEETKEIFNQAAFNKMKPSAIFINTSRGGLVQQDALISALKTGEIYAAGLDVMTPEPIPTNHELTTLNNCVLTPHMGTCLLETEMEMMKMAAKNILAVKNNQQMPAEVPL